MAPATKEGEVEDQHTGHPVGHGCNIPGRALATGYGHILTQLTTEGTCLVEGGRNITNKFGGLLLAHVFCRRVSKHLQRGIENHIHGHLMAACALAHGVVVVAEEIIPCSIVHSARRVVQRTTEHAEIGDADIVSRLVVLRTVAHTGLPLRILQTFHALKVQHIGIGSVDSHGFQSVVI